MEFSERINELYPEIYAAGTNEGKIASDHFEKWGWYAMIYELAKGKLWKMEFVEKTNVHQAHIYFAYRIDNKKLKHQIAQGTATNTIQL